MNAGCRPTAYKRPILFEKEDLENGPVLTNFFSKMRYLRNGLLSIHSTVFTAFSQSIHTDMLRGHTTTVNIRARDVNDIVAVSTNRIRLHFQMSPLCRTAFSMVFVLTENDERFDNVSADCRRKRVKAFASRFQMKTYQSVEGE